MRKTLIASAIFFLIFFYGLLLSQTRVSVIADELEPKNATGFYDYRGVSNVHTDRGLGSGSPMDVIKSGQEAALDFLILTDLNQLSETTVARPVTSDSYHRKTLVISANEYSYLDSRFLLYNIQKRRELETLGQAQLLLADLLSQPKAVSRDDLIVLAHPTKPGFGWNGPYPSGLDGIEVMNLKTAWRTAWESNKLSFLWSVFVYPFNSELALIRLYDEPNEELELWDHLSTTRHTVGMAGSEATAKTASIGDLSLKFPSYQTSFNLLSNHVLLKTELTGEAEGDRKKILSALAAGEFYMSLDVLGNPKGFTTYLINGDHTLLPGSHVKMRPGLKIMVHLPSQPKVPFESALIKDGQHIASTDVLDSTFEITSPGVYRIIVRVFVGFTLPDGIRWVTWIYSNPFTVE